VLGCEQVGWCNDKIGPTAPPIETPGGWLALIHVVDRDDARPLRTWERRWTKRYTVGMVLLDLEEPWRVIGACPRPVMVPDERYPYEIDGFRGSVLFPTGMIAEDDGTVKVYYGASDTVVALATAPLISRFLLFVFAQLLVLSYAYSAPPLRLKDRPVGGLFANAWGHGLLVSVAVMPDMTIHNAGLLDWHIPIYFFFAVAATYVLTTIPDRVGDAVVGKRTTAVVLGRSGALAAALVLLVLAAFTAFTSQHALLFYLAVGAGFAVVAALFLGGDATARFAAKAPLMVLTLAAGYLYPLYLVFVVALLIATRAYYHKRFGVVYPELA